MAPKSNHAIFYVKILFSRYPWNHPTFGLLYKDKCHQELSKIVQSGHTGRQQAAVAAATKLLVSSYCQKGIWVSQQNGSTNFILLRNLF